MVKIEMEVVNSTPLLPGWYNPELVDPMGLRASEIKGIWRWWARAIIGGALYDNCMLVGESRDKDGIVRKPSRREAELISCLVGKILGLGYVGQKEAESSRFIIRIETLKKEVSRITRDSEIARKYQRLNLLTRGKRPPVELEYIPPLHSKEAPERARFRIIVDRVRSGYADAEDLAAKILILALQLSGVGKGSRRGLGSLDIISLSGITIPDKLKDLLDSVYNDAIKVVNNHVKNCPTPPAKLCDKRTLPPLPVISKTSIQDININVDINGITGIYVIKSSGKNLEQMFCDIHNFFLRSERCKKLYGNPKCYDDLRINRLAWILGLPRRGKKKEKEERRKEEREKDTGYKAIGVDRRASPIIISYHSEANMFERNVVFATIMMSGDWPKKIIWLGNEDEEQSSKGEDKEPDIDEVKIASAISIAFGEFKGYVNSAGYTLEKVWP